MGFDLTTLLRICEDLRDEVAMPIRSGAYWQLCWFWTAGAAAKWRRFPSGPCKAFGKRIFLRKGEPLPSGVTAAFNARPENVISTCRETGESDLMDWFDTDRRVRLDEEVIGLGGYGFTLTVLSSEALAEPDGEDEDDEEAMNHRWTPRFAYGR